MRQSIISFSIAVLLGWMRSSVAYPPQPFIKVLQAPPMGLYVPVARLVVNAAAGLDRAQALTALEHKAQELGANAVIVSDGTRPAEPDLISRATDAVLEEVRECQNRPPDPLYPVILFDALWVKFPDDGLASGMTPSLGAHD